jgi:hypothetical protein
MATVNVDVQVDLKDFSTESLFEELEDRGELYNIEQFSDILNEIWRLRRNGKDYEKVLDDLIFMGLGKTI